MLTEQDILTQKYIDVFLSDDYWLVSFEKRFKDELNWISPNYSMYDINRFGLGYDLFFHLENPDVIWERFFMVLKANREVKGYTYFLNTLYWKIVTDKVKKMGKYICKGCGESEQLNGAKLRTHHLTYDNHCREHLHMEDLLLVCSDCHTKIHRDDAFKNIIAKYSDALVLLSTEELEKIKVKYDLAHCTRWKDNGDFYVSKSLNIVFVYDLMFDCNNNIFWCLNRIMDNHNGHFKADE